jgi:2-haloacid dehalogenase
MTRPSKHVVFDVVGTCVSFDAYYERIDSVMGAKLRENTITPEHFGFTWQTDAELEFTFLSISGSYKTYREVLRGLFYRTLSFCGIANPRTFATDEDRERCIEGYSALELRPSCSEAFQILRSNGFTVWCFTSGDVQRVKGYFERAGVDMPEKNLVSCDSLGVAKPALPAYEHVWNQLGRSDVKWFAAAHMWDVAAATKVGFRGAWSSVFEKEACSELHRDTKLEVLADDLVDVARQIVEKSEAS